MPTNFNPATGTVDQFTNPTATSNPGYGATARHSQDTNQNDSLVAVENAIVTLWPLITEAMKGSNNLSDLVSAVTARSNLGLGSAAVLGAAAVAQTANNLSDLASAPTALANLVNTGTFADKGGQVFNVKAEGAKGNGVTSTAGTTTASSTAFTDTSGNVTFTSNDVGKVIQIAGAGASGATLTTTISAFVSSTAVTLGAAASTAITGTAVYVYGTDDSTAIQNTINACLGAGGGKVFFPTGMYLIGTQLVPANNLASASGLDLTFTGPESAVLRCTSTFGSGGLFGYGLSGTNPNVARCHFDGLTLDGAWVGAGGTVVQPASNAGALIALPWPWTSGSSTARNGLFHTVHRTRFYRPTGYCYQPTNGIKETDAVFDTVGQPSATSHYDCHGSGTGEAILKGSTWYNSAGNYVDFVSATGYICLQMSHCKSYNHGAGGVYGCGTGSIITDNDLDATSGGIGYDVGTTTRSNNTVANNNVPNMTVDASLSIANGDQVWGNTSADATPVSFVKQATVVPTLNAATSAVETRSGFVYAQNGFELGTPTLSPSPPDFKSDGTNMYVEAKASGAVYLRPNGANNNYAVAISTSNGIVVNDGTATSRFTVTPAGHIVSAAASISSVTAGAGLGTSPPTATISGNDVRGTITFGTGTSPAAGTILSVTFTTAYTSAPFINLTLANAALAGVTTGDVYVAAVSTTGFSIGFSAALAASQAATTYAVSYRVTG